MSKPATEMRLVRAAEGFTQVIGRGDSHIITKNPTTGKCAYDGQVGGGWHYGAGLETDTAWTAGVAPWNWQMTKANYNVFALSQFNQGQIIKWVDPGTGQYVAFQPMALQWTNSLNQIQQISMPQSVVAQVTDDVLYWPAAYGTGRSLRYQASPLRLNKQLIIDFPSALPATTYDTLELNFIISVSSGVNIMVNGAAWDKKTKKDTTQSIAFQLPGGAVVWSFAVPRAWDSAGGLTTGAMRLKKSGNSLYVSVRFPKAWIDSILPANYPIVFDPEVNYQVGANGDDGIWRTGVFNNYGAELYIGRYLTDPFTSFVLFAGVTLPAECTITSATISYYFSTHLNSMESCKLYAEDAANPSAVSGESDGNSRTKSTGYATFTPPTSGTWWSITITSLIAAIKNAYDYSSGANMQFFAVGPAGSTTFLSRPYSYNGDPEKSAKLHIEYTEAAGGCSLAFPSRRRSFQGLIVR